MSQDIAGIQVDDQGVARCWWSASDRLYQTYHDVEWGRPVADDRRLFEKLCLEGFQAGLSWITILRKRDNFRAAFDDFDVERVAGFDVHRIEELMADTGIHFLYGRPAISRLAPAALAKVNEILRLSVKLLRGFSGRLPAAA